VACVVAVVVIAVVGVDAVVDVIVVSGASLWEP
jgi:hypothetical protein